jgi:hypothetical protein
LIDLVSQTFLSPTQDFFDPSMASSSSDSKTYSPIVRTPHATTSTSQLSSKNITVRGTQPYFLKGKMECNLTQNLEKDLMREIFSLKNESTTI